MIRSLQTLLHHCIVLGSLEKLRNKPFFRTPMVESVNLFDIQIREVAFFKDVRKKLSSDGYKGFLTHFIVLGCLG